MPEFAYTDLLPLGPDETPYRLLTTEGVSVVEATLHAPIATDSEQYRRDDDTRRTPLYVVKHADS